LVLRMAGHSVPGLVVLAVGRVKLDHENGKITLQFFV
jgi:hypothetical protein